MIFYDLTNVPSPRHLSLELDSLGCKLGANLSSPTTPQISPNGLLTNQMSRIGHPILQDSCILPLL
jgi:hypothetical protein